MDSTNWGLRYWPFERTYAADRYFSSSSHEEALARLLFLVEEPGRTGILQGGAGTGKTFLLKLLQQKAARLGRLTVRCDATGLEGTDLALQIALACHVPCGIDTTSGRIWSGLQARFAALAVVQQPLVIIIDHFDQVDVSCQQAVVRLRQIAESAGTKLTLLLATRSLTSLPVVQEIVDLRIELAPLSIEEIAQFLTTITTKCGAPDISFTDDALAAVHRLTGGVFTSIVTLCNLALLGALSEGDTTITRQFVEAASTEMPTQVLRPNQKSWPTRELAGTVS